MDQYRAAVDLPDPGQADLVREIAPGRHRHYYSEVDDARMAQARPEAVYALVPLRSPDEIASGACPERLLARLPEVPPAPTDEAGMLAAMAHLQAAYPALDLPSRAPWAGWVPLIEAACRRIMEEVPADALVGVKTLVMKEKFGGLSWYWQAPAATPEQRETLFQIIDRDLGSASWRTCQVCGRPGRLRQKAWWTTRCDQHVGARP